MTRIVTIPGYIQARPADKYEAVHFDGMHFKFWEHKDMSAAGYTLVCPYTMTVEVPDGWDPRPDQVKALQTQKAKLAAALLAIDQQIANLLCIENAA